MVLDIFQKFEKLRDVFQACKYFCIIVKRLYECLEVLNIFQNLYTLKYVCHASKHFYMTFLKTPRLPEGPKHFSEIVEALECLSTL